MTCGQPWDDWSQGLQPAMTKAQICWRGWGKTRHWCCARFFFLRTTTSLAAHGEAVNSGWSNITVSRRAAFSSVICKNCYHIQSNSVSGFVLNCYDSFRMFSPVVQFKIILFFLMSCWFCWDSSADEAKLVKSILCSESVFICCVSNSACTGRKKEKKRKQHKFLNCQTRIMPNMENKSNAYISKW